MKILVTIKEVPDGESLFTINQSGSAVIPEENSLFRMNRYDEFALEEGLRIKEEYPESTVTAVSVGSEQTKRVLKRAIEMGADNTLLLKVDNGEEHIASVVSKLIADYIESERFDLIISGIMAEDTLQGKTGQMIAGLLGISCGTSVVNQTINSEKFTIKVERELDAQNSESVVLKLPALITVQSGINQPRYPSLSNKLRARDQSIPVIDAAGDILNSSKVQTVFVPITTEKEIKILNGTAQEKAIELVSIMREKGIL